LTNHNRSAQSRLPGRRIGLCWRATRAPSGAEARPRRRPHGRRRGWLSPSHALAPSDKRTVTLPTTPHPVRQMSGSTGRNPRWVRAQPNFAPLGLINDRTCIPRAAPWAGECRRFAAAPLVVRGAPDPAPSSTVGLRRRGAGDLRSAECHGQETLTQLARP
jgi:hypothetical protein